MNKLLALLALFLLPSLALASPEALLAAGRLILGGHTESPPPLAPDDPAWDRAPEARLVLYPQQGIAPGFDTASMLPVGAKILVGAGQLAVWLTWRDAGEDRVDRRATHRFADAAAVQFPVDPVAGLPYVGMGEPHQPVTLWFWRAGGKAERLAARGFGTLETAPGPLPEVQARRTQAGWRLVLRGPLPRLADPLLLALAIWDGVEDGRNGRKHLSHWIAVRLPSLAPDAALYQRLAEEARIAGDAERGRRLAAERGCAGCHKLPGSGTNALAPGLLQAGGIHWPGYLRRAVAEPSGFIVPGERYAAAEGLSIMPKETWAPDALEDLVAYLMTLR